MSETRMDIEQASRLFQALSDETRLRIVRMLSRGECCVCDLQGVVGAYQSRLSFHLRKLKDAGLVTDRKEGRWVYYTLRPEVLAEMSEFLTGVTSDAEPWQGPEGCGDGGGCCVV